MTLAHMKYRKYCTSHKSSERKASVEELPGAGGKSENRRNKTEKSMVHPRNKRGTCLFQEVC